MSKRRAQAHAKHEAYCTCGKSVAGNGAIYQHRAMHTRRGDGHRYMSYSEYWDKKKKEEHTP